MFDYPIDDVYVFVRLDVASFAGSSVPGYAELRLCRSCRTLRLVGYRRCVSYPINEYCVQYTVYINSEGVLLCDHNAKSS